MKKQIHPMLWLVLITCLSACSEHKKIENDLDAYSERLQSYTGITLSKENFSYQLDAPTKTAFKQNINDININMREFYALNDCVLNQLVAQRNTALGKMQLPSARYAYESQLVVELTKCAQVLRSDAKKTDVVNKLTLWTSEKQQQLPIAWANLVTQSQEVYSHFTTASGFISGKASDNFVPTTQAFRFLLASQTAHPVDLSELELHLQQLGSSPLIARQWRTQLLVTQKLNHISPLLVEYLKDNQCQTLEEIKGIEIMQNIFRKFFAETIQSLAGELNRYHYQLSPLIEQLSLSPHFTENFSTYLTHHNTIKHQAYKKSMQTHITLWQEVFVHCN